MSNAYHPHTDGQAEIVNKSLEQYLRAFTSDNPHRWAKWLPLAEFWFNSNFHTSLKLTHFEALYCFPPPTLQSYVPGTTREVVLATLRANLAAAQERMKVKADKHKQERSFEVGDWVYLKLQPYRQRTLAYKGKWKLSPRYFGLFQVLQKVGTVSYKLDLPPEAKLHLVFPCVMLEIEAWPTGASYSYSATCGC